MLRLQQSAFWQQPVDQLPRQHLSKHESLQQESAAEVASGSSVTTVAQPAASMKPAAPKLPTAASATAAAGPLAEEAWSEQKLPAARSATAAAGLLAELTAEKASTLSASRVPGSGPAAGSAARDSPAGNPVVPLHTSPIHDSMKERRAATLERLSNRLIALGENVFNPFSLTASAPAAS